MSKLSFNHRPSQLTYIAVEGPLGAGKTTLVNLLAKKLQCRQYLETIENNPFLSDYVERKLYAFQTEIFSLLSRFKQQETLPLFQGHLFDKYIFSDYMFSKSRLLASLTLSDQELAMYDKVYDILAPQVTEPDLIIYLHAPIGTLVRRLVENGRYASEQEVDREYVGQVSRLYKQFFRHYDAKPVLWVDSSKCDFKSENSDALETILQDVETLWGEHVVQRDRLDNRRRSLG